MLPEGWRETTLENVCSKPICYGIVQAGPHINEGVYYIKSSDIKDGKIDNVSGLSRTSIEIHRKYERSSIFPGDIILSLRGNIGECAIVPNDIYEGNLTQGTARICLSDGYYNEFVKNYILFINSMILKRAKGSTFKEISIEELRKIKIRYPQIVEQEKIAAILSTWDKAISTTDALLANSRQQKKALMQQLLTGKRRLPGFTGEWKFPSARKLFKNISIKHRPEETLLAVTQTEGVIPRHLLDRRVVMPEGDVNLYKLVKKGDFIISLRSFQGGLEYSSYQGLVSPAYTVITKCCDIDDIFYKHYFKSALFIGKLAVAVIGIRDGKQISYEDFSCIRLPYPPLDEQRAIAAVLDAADREIVLLEQKAARLREEKKALMQQLLTGKRRVRL